MQVEDIDFHVQWSGEDDVWMCTCNAFPSLSWLSESPERALAGLIIVISEIIESELDEDVEEDPCDALTRESERLGLYDDIFEQPDITTGGVIQAQAAQDEVEEQ